MYDARLIFNDRRTRWELWFDEWQVMSHPERGEVEAWAGRHNYTLTEEPE
jgi:hypothetical protein